MEALVALGYSSTDALRAVRKVTDVPPDDVGSHSESSPSKICRSLYGKRMITTDVTEEDFPLEGNLRPQTLEEYIGQEKTKKH